MTAAAEQSIRVPVPRLARALIAIQAIFWGVYTWTLLLLLIAVVKFGGLGFYPFARADMRDPKDVLGLGMVAGGILHMPVYFVVMYGLPVAASSAAAGVILLIAQGYGGLMSKKLLVSTILTVAAVAVQLTPFGILVRQWVLD
jgi:hypothetical protein